MKNFVSIKKAAKILNVSTEEVKQFLFDRGIITMSDIPSDTEGLVAEIRVVFAHHEETTLCLTIAGVIYLISEMGGSDA